MIDFIKKNIRAVLKSVTEVLSSTKVGRFVNELIIDDVMRRVQKVEFHGVNLSFVVPNSLNRYRVETFSTKEPETLEWINEIPFGAHLWDIGANVGLYSIFAAKKGISVHAFEPSVFNLEILARNIFLNGVVDNITIIPLPLSGQLEESRFKLTTTEWGGAMSVFDKGFGADGNRIKEVFEYSTLGISMIDAVEGLKIRSPDYIKMDVDGIEHVILSGGLKVLKSVKSILIEINDHFEDQAKEAKFTLEKSGFFLKEKRHAEFFDSIDSPAKYTFNQIWNNNILV